MSNLERRVARVEERAGATRERLIFVDTKPGETNDEAIRRHYAAHPEDKGATTIVMWEGLPREPRAPATGDVDHL